MNKLYQVIIALLLVGSTVALSCDKGSVCHEVESRYFDSGSLGSFGSDSEFAEYVKSTFEGAAAGGDYCFASEPDFPFTNNGMCSGSTQHIVWKVDLYFEDSVSGNMAIQLGSDFGNGYAIYVDGVFASADTDNIWWDNNWSNSDVIAFDTDYTAGEHVVTFYGFEDCCDGAFDLQYRINSDFSADNECPQGQVCSFVESRYYDSSDMDFSGTDDEFAAFVKSSFEGAYQKDRDYCARTDPDFPIKNEDMCGGNTQHIVWRFDFYFTDAQSGNFELLLGADFGGGYAVYVDGVLSSAVQDDIWWSTNWDNSDVITLNTDYESGSHVVTFYGFEDCCDGDFNIQYRINSDAVDFVDCPNEELCTVMETRYFDSGDMGFDGTDEEFANYVKDSFMNAHNKEERFCRVEEPSFPFNHDSICGGQEQHIVWKWDFYFNDNQAGSYEMKMGADFGQGYGYFLDGAFVSSSQDDWWWNNDWSNSDVLTFTGNYEAGFHHIEIFGFEDCCDGNFDLQWSLSSNQVTCDEVTIYSGCDYTGESMVVTEDTDCIAWDPQSVCIPDGVTIEIHDLCYYQGDTKTVDASVECFPTEGQTLLEKDGKKLKKNSKKSADKPAHISILA